MRTVLDIRRAICAVAGLDYAGLLCRKDRVGFPMMARTAFYVLARIHKHSIPAIGRAVERDHTTVYNAIARYGTHPDVVHLITQAEFYLAKPTWRDRFRESNDVGPPA